MLNGPYRAISTDHDDEMLQTCILFIHCGRVEDVLCLTSIAFVCIAFWVWVGKDRYICNACAFALHFKCYWQDSHAISMRQIVIVDEEFLVCGEYSRNILGIC